MRTTASLLWQGWDAAFLASSTTTKHLEKGTEGRKDRSTAWIAFLFPDMHLPCWSCLHEGQPPTDHWQAAAATKLFSFSLTGLLPSPELPSPSGSAGRAPPPVAHLPVPPPALKTSSGLYKKGKSFLCSISIPKPHGYFFSPYSLFQYLESSPLTADTVLILLFSVIPSVAAVPSPLYFEAVRLMLKKPASVSYRELSQASF